MLKRPLYQSSVAFLTVIALVGGVAVLLAGGGGPGIEIIPATQGAQSAAVASTGPIDQHLLNINTANARELDETLPGIGPVLAERIVAHREQNGPFARTDQLMLVAGIGEATYERLRGLVTVE